MNTSKLYKHRSLVGYLWAVIRAGSLWRWCALAAKYMRRVRLIQLLYRILRWVLLVVQAGAVGAFAITALIVCLPLLSVYAIFLLIEQRVICLRWSPVLEIVCACSGTCCVFFCSGLPENSFLLANARAISTKGTATFLVVPFRKNAITFRRIKRIDENLFLVDPSIYFYVRRKILKKNLQKCVFVLSDFDTSNPHYTTKVA